jgi:hypothetical protein
MAVGADGVITPALLGPNEVWPFRIERGTIVCIEDAVFISDGHTSYPLNGPAKALTRHDPKDRKPLADIWLVDQKTLDDVKDSGIKVQMIRMNISPARTALWTGVALDAESVAPVATPLEVAPRPSGSLTVATTRSVPMPERAVGRSWL